MSNIISDDNSPCTADIDTSSILSHEAILAAGETRFDPTAPAPQEYLDALCDQGSPLPEWAEDPDRYLENEAKCWETYQLKLQKEMRVLARARAARATRRYRGQIRARRSPASTRRATTDSGGDDGDGGGDPEPPHRPRICNLPANARGGAL